MNKYSPDCKKKRVILAGRDKDILQEKMMSQCMYRSPLKGI